MRCDDVADQLPAWAEGGGPLASPVTEHIGACLRCQASVAQYRRLRRVALELRQHCVAPTRGGLAGVLDNVAAAGERSALRGLRSGRRAAYWGGLVLLTTAAGAAGVLVVAGRARRGRLAN
jgi:hypothetical protein